MTVKVVQKPMTSNSKFSDVSALKIAAIGKLHLILLMS